MIHEILTACYCRYRKADERQSLDGPMSRLLPRLHHISVQLFSDPSELSVLVQKQILKVFYSLIQVRIVEVFAVCMKSEAVIVIYSRLCYTLVWRSSLFYGLESTVTLYPVLLVRSFPDLDSSACDRI